jgi:hypothetical protein
MQESARRQLLSGERVLWEGTPSTGLILRPTEAFLIPFSLLWGGFALFWNIGVWTTDADLSFKLFGLPFLVAGCYITVGRFWLDMHLRRRLLYLVTDRRILILKQGRGTTSNSLDIKRLPALALEERSDGSGTIRFGAAASLFNGSNSGIWQASFDPTPQFIRIPNVRSVYELIQRQV